MTFQIKKIEKPHDTELLELSGVLNAESVEQFRDHILRIADSDLNLVVLDMRQLEEIDSSGVGAIISLLKHMRLKHGELRLVKIRGAVKKLFELLRIDRGLDIYEDTDKALNLA